eukprot:IDg23688t1
MSESTTAIIFLLATPPVHQRISPYSRIPVSITEANFHSRTPTAKYQNRRPDSSAPNQRDFDDARRRQQCFRCRQPWKPGHRCASNSSSVRYQVRQRIQNGESPTYLLSELADALESELHEGSPPDDTAEDDIAETHHLEESLAEFDSHPESTDNNFPTADDVDANYATHFLSASMKYP